MDPAHKPDEGIAKESLPEPLYRAIVFLFSQDVPDSMLVGGSALSGFYAGHRRSDDLDIFVRSPLSFQQMILAVRALKDLGTEVQEGTHSQHYYRATCTLEGHTFTIDLVLDANVFEVGAWHLTDSGVCVADLATLFKMKSATLLSRCSEKDLFDLQWLFSVFPEKTTLSLMEAGRCIDGGMSAENLLYSISSATLKQDACGFGLKPADTPAVVYERVSLFREQLTREFDALLTNSPPTELGQIVARLRKLKGKEGE